MQPSYRRGVAIVLGTIAWSALIHLAYATFAPARPPAVPAAQDLGEGGWPLGPFALVDQDGRPATDRDLADRVWLASFLFTRCPTACPRIAATVKSLQDRFEGGGVRLVSISVDPDRDTPPVLAAFADRFGARPGRWSFLTGGKAAVYDLVLKRFRLPVAEATAAQIAEGADAVIHSDRLALVDRGNRVVGFARAGDADALKELVERATRLDAAPSPTSWVRRLPLVNAGLNSVCTVLLVAGWVQIRAGRTRAHIGCMAAAVAVSALFLSCYLVYHAHVGSVPFRGVGPVRHAYFTILLSHTILAAAIVPLIALTLIRALRGRYEAHVRVSRVTFPIWVYVSVTGVVIYLMLYRLPVTSAPLPA